jgi:hypothetical protein
MNCLDSVVPVALIAGVTGGAAGIILLVIIAAVVTTLLVKCICDKRKRSALLGSFQLFIVNRDY